MKRTGYMRNIQARSSGGEHHLDAVGVRSSNLLVPTRKIQGLRFLGATPFFILLPFCYHSHQKPSFPNDEPLLGSWNSSGGHRQLASRRGKFRNRAVIHKNNLSQVGFFRDAARGEKVQLTNYLRGHSLRHDGQLRRCAPLRRSAQEKEPIRLNTAPAGPRDANGF
jgi:hypothetical protein